MSFFPVNFAIFYSHLLNKHLNIASLLSFFSLFFSNKDKIIDVYINNYKGGGGCGRF